MSRNLLSFLMVPLTLAAACPPAIAGDARLLTQTYDPNEVVRVDGRAGVQASISFAPDEHIENVAIGSSNAWQITPNKRANVLFVKPLQPEARTNLTVITDQRSYFFDLVASSSGPAIYGLRFSYPASARASAEAGGATGAGGTGMSSHGAALNFAWQSKGKAALLPMRVYDDGVSVFLVWPQGARLPAILTSNDKGELGPVNYAVRGDTIVVDGAPRKLILRSGKDTAQLENRSTTAKPRSTANTAQTLANRQGF
jgi:Type IV secretory pathway, VirB9 components